MTDTWPVTERPRVPGRPVHDARLHHLGLVAGGVVALLLGTLVVSLFVGGGAPAAAPPGLPDAGTGTAWALPVTALLVRVAAVATVGTLLLGAVLSPAGAASGPRARRAASWWAALWAVATAAEVVLMVSTLTAVPVTRLSLGAVAGYLSGFAPGRAAVVVLVSLSAVALLAGRARSRPAALTLLLAALGAVVLPVVLAGHSAAAEDHVMAVTSIAVHVAAASVWVGGLLALLVHARADGPLLARTAARFSVVALVCFVLTGATGVVGAWVLLGGSGAGAAANAALVTGSGYGAMLLAKTVALLGLGVLGALHRRWSLGRLAAGRPSVFRRLAAVEVVVMLATVSLAVGLAAAPPPNAAGPGASATTASSGGSVDVPAAPGADAGPAPGEATEGVPDMSGHDHGDLSVGVLVDDERFHVSSTVAPGQSVTVYNSSSGEVSITADDGSFDTSVADRTFVTFVAPSAPGMYGFTSRHDAERYRDVLVVE